MLYSPACILSMCMFFFLTIVVGFSFSFLYLYLLLFWWNFAMIFAAMQFGQLMATLICEHALCACINHFLLNFYGLE